MKNMKMKTKMIIAFVVPTVFIIVNVVVGILSINNIRTRFTDERHELVTTIQATLDEMNADSSKAERLVDTVTTLQEESKEGIGRLVNNSNIFSFALVVISVIITVVLSTSLIKAISKSIRQLSRAAKEIASGRVDVEMEKYNNDEFGELVDEYTHVIDNMKYQANIAKEVANGNLTVQVDVKSSEDVLTGALKKLVDDNFNALSNISEAGTQVTLSSSQVASASQALAQGSTEQASAIEEITASIDEIADKTKQNAEQANSAAGLVVQAIDDVKHGNKQMQEMVTAMADINKASESISKIIKTIDDIAFQTNILALNAAVEAARAGEHGKGFAVVAEEVRSLAAKSAEAASETADMIEDSIQKVQNGSALAERTAKMLDEIVSAVDAIVSLIQDIAGASNEQASVLVQIEQAVNQVSQVVQQNSATSEECAAASEELSNQARNLEQLIGKYSLRSTTGSRLGYSSVSTDSFGPSIGYGGQQASGSSSTFQSDSFTGSSSIAGAIPDASDFAGMSDTAQNEQIISLEDDVYSKY